jgi:bis(5'-nucleosidyl)-tetraphosphatase
MPAEHSAGAIVFREEAGLAFFLLLHYEKGHWGASKGHIEKGETIEETARREVREETGISDLVFRPGFKETIRYFFQGEQGRTFKTVTFLLAETRTREVVVSFEHTGFEWLPYAGALSRTTFKDEKAVLEKAARFLSLEPQN